jgi:hypothetical protein
VAKAIEHEDEDEDEDDYEDEDEDEDAGACRCGRTSSASPSNARSLPEDGNSQSLSFRTLGNPLIWPRQIGFCPPDETALLRPGGAMKLHVRIGLYALLLACGLFLGLRLEHIYTHRSAPKPHPVPQTNSLPPATNAALPPTNAAAPATNPPVRTAGDPEAEPIEQFRPTGAWFAQMATYGALLLGVLVGLGILVARDLSHFTAHRVEQFLFNDDGEGMRNPEYEEAEELWKQGRHLDAVQLLRDYYKRNPREVYVAMRIAEIYEQDLNNPLAAALEYEEVLKKNLPPERWGWAAIHLSNLYTGKLNKNAQALELLQRIVAECANTAPANKALDRLKALQAEHPELVKLPQPPAPEPEPEPPPPPPGPKLPPGFRPKAG